MAEHETVRLTRRQALATSLASGLAAMGAKPAPAASEAAAKTPPRIGCGTVSFRTCSLEEALRRIRRAGYEYFETQATAPFCPHVDPWKDDPAKFRKLAADLGFRGVTALWSCHGAIIPDAKSVEGISQVIRWAKEAEVPVVVAGDGRKPANMSDDDAMKLLGDRLAAILELAEQLRIHLAIEPHGTFSLTADGLKRIMALSNSKWLAINYDTANVHRATYVETAEGGYSWTPFGQRQDEVATLRAVVDRVIHVHVKDVVGAKCVALGKGTVNVLGCLRVLREAGYGGVVSLETEGDFDAEEGQRLIAASYRYLVEASERV